MAIALLASPGMSIPLSEIGDAFMERGIRPYYVILGAGSTSFIQEAKRLRRADGRVLPALIEKYAPGVDPSSPVFSFGYSAGSWLARDGILTHPADRAQTRGVVYGDGLHANDSQLQSTRDYLSEGGNVLVIHSDVVPGGYPSTGDTAKRLAAATPPSQKLTVAHAPGDHTYTSLKMRPKIESWLDTVLAGGGGSDDEQAPPLPPDGGDDGGGIRWFSTIEASDVAAFGIPCVLSFLVVRKLGQG